MAAQTSGSVVAQDSGRRVLHRVLCFTQSHYRVGNFPEFYVFYFSSVGVWKWSQAAEADPVL